MPFKSRLLASTVVPLAIVIGAGALPEPVPGSVAGKPAHAACAPCSPCAAKVPGNPCAAAGPGNPCAAKRPDNPYAAKNPCNPCAAAAKAGASNCVVPRLAKASVGGGNPCAAKSPCNPCAAKSPCNPCAARNPCNPCAAGGSIELTDAEAAAAYDCVIDQLRPAYAKSGDEVAARYRDWPRYSRVAYQSATHGGRYVQNYANDAARAYGAFEDAGPMPAGAIIAKDSFAVGGNGSVSSGPLFVMQKMPAGFNGDSRDWKYTMIMPDGTVFGVTNGKNAAGMQFCYECHNSVAEEQDSLMYLPDEYRVR